jgi:hypothetical protein
MKDTYYFSHDSDATDDPKIMLLISQWGLEAYGIFWTIIEHLRKQPEYKSHIGILKALASRYGSTEEKYKFVVFDFNLFEIEDNVFFYSKSLIKRMKPLEDKREQMRQLALKRWNKKDASAMRTHNDTQSVGNASKVKESKGKESKEVDIYAKQKSFYKSEFEKATEHKSDYSKFIKALFKKNDLDKELGNVLRIKDQLTYTQFVKILFLSKDYKKQILEVMLSMENKPKAIKGNTSLYMTLRNWIKFSK